MNQKEMSVVSDTEAMIKEMFLSEGSGHDRRHIQRVWKLALSIAETEGGNPYIVSLIALLHDIADYKFNEGNETIGGEKAREWLESLEVEENIIVQVQRDVDHISFKGETSKNTVLSLEGKIVQDADRIDAIGAIGIARTFAYGGAKGRAMHNPNETPNQSLTKQEYMSSETSTVTHFYDKLLRVKALMNTPTGEKIAEKRHEYMEGFLNEFYLERDGKDTAG